MNETLTTDEAARVLGLRPATVRRWVMKGWLRPVTGGRPLRFRWLDVEQARAERMAPDDRARLDALAREWRARCLTG